MAKFCSRCGKAIDENTVYCPFCGAYIAENNKIMNNPPVQKATKKVPVLLFILIPVFILVIGIIAFFLIRIVYVRTDNDTIKSVERIFSGLSGETVTYTLDIPVDAPTDKEIADVIEILEQRIKNNGTKATAEPLGDNQIRLEVQITNNIDEIVAESIRAGTLTFQDTEGNILLSSHHIKEAKAAENKNTGVYEVDLKLTEDGTAIFSKVTKENIGKTLSIYIDDTCILSAAIQEQITGGECVISNLASKEEAESMADLINSGALPYALTIADRQE